MKLVVCPNVYTEKETGQVKQGVAVYIVEPSRHLYIRVKSVFKADSRTLLAAAENVNVFDDVLRAAGLEPREKAPAKK